MIVSIGKRIRDARKAKGWSQEMLGQAVGRAQNAISGWETGRTEPSRIDAMRIASRLGIPLREIENGPASADTLLAQLIPYVPWVDVNTPQALGSVDLASRAESVAVSDLPDGEWFATDVTNDRMDRISPEGSRILVNKQDRRLLPGRAYIFERDGQMIYGIYQAQPVPRIEPHSTNPLNKTVFLTDSDMWNVIGRVWRSYIEF